MGIQVSGVRGNACALRAVGLPESPELCARRCSIGARVETDVAGPQDVCALWGLAIADLLRLLADIEAEAAASRDRLRACVAVLRVRRATWREIGDALEVSRQAAWERFSDVVDAGPRGI